MHVLYVLKKGCALKSIVKLRSKSRSGGGQLQVWKVRVRLGPAPESIPNDLKLSDTLFLVFTITLFHQLDQCNVEDELV